MSDQLRLLVVDHDPTHRAALRHSLGQSTLEATVVEAATLSEGLARLAEGSWDCIIVDQDLPDRGAIKLTTEVRGEGANPLPIVFLTGLHDEDALQQAIDSGV